MLLILSVSLVLLLVAVDGEVGCSLSYFPSIYVGVGVLVGDELIAAHPLANLLDAAGALPFVQTSTPQAMPASGAVWRTCRRADLPISSRLSDVPIPRCLISYLHSVRPSECSDFA